MPRGKKSESKSGKGASFEDRLNRLEEIAGSLSQGKLQLHEALEMYEEGMEIVKSLRNTLDDSKAKVEKLNRLTGALEEFNLGESSST